MTPYAHELTRALLASHSAADVTALLNRTLSGAPVTLSDVEAVRRGMAAPPPAAMPQPGPGSAGTVTPPPRPPRTPAAPEPNRGERFTAWGGDPAGCDALHFATMRMYYNFARSRRCSVEAARQYMLYSPAALAKMANAA